MVCDVPAPLDLVDDKCSIWLQYNDNTMMLDDSSRVRQASSIVQKAARREHGDHGATVATEGVSVVPVLSSLLVRGTVLRLDTDTAVVYGTGVCCVDGKEMETNIPVVHASMTVDGVRVLVTSIFSECIVHTRRVSHFVSSSDTRCVNVRGLQLGRRCESSIIWQPMLSHFKRRKDTTDAHIACFKNLGLELLQTKHRATPLFDVLLSQTTAGSLTCYSVFM
jgi:hypothetical protein